MESFLRTYQVLVECLVKQGQQRKKAIRKISSAAKSEVHSLVEGIVDVGETATKHYMHDEIVQLLEEVGFAVQSIDRVEFPWAEVIDHPPQWLKKPYPWDWMVVAGR